MWKTEGQCGGLGALLDIVGGTLGGWRLYIKLGGIAGNYGRLVPLWEFRSTALWDIWGSVAGTGPGERRPWSRG